MGKYRDPSDKDKYICPHCGKGFRHRSPYMYAPRFLVEDAPIQVIDTWNIPYSTGFYILSQAEVPEEAVEAFANEKADFPHWPLQRHGVLWSKDTWDD